MRLAREGYPFVAAGLFLAGSLWVAVWASAGGGGLVVEAPGREPGPGAAAVALQLAAWTCTLLAAFVLWFFRDPQPRVPADPELVVAPGQGRVIGVAETREESFLGGAATKISIFLSVFDVHVQRAPVSGRVALKQYRPGAYAVAWADKASDENEQASLGISTQHGHVLVRQIAGLVARRIVTDPGEGDSVERGRRFGIIRFGSRVDLFLPRHWEVLCAVGDRVRVGSSVLARQRAEAD